MTPLRPTLLLLASLALSPAARAAAPAEPAPGPVQRFAVVAGSNDGGGGRARLRFASTDAKAVARVLTQLGGIEPGDLVVLEEPRRAQVLSALDRIGHRVEAARGARRRTEVLLYYSGHSDERGLLPGGEPLLYGDLRAAIDRLGADVRIAILDSCSAGSFTRRKGGVFRPPFLVDDSVQVRGHAFLASSSESEAAQESDRIRGSFFTHYLVTGLRGAADASGDRRVTLNEAYTFAFRETLAGTENTSAGAQHPAYDIEMSGTGDVVLTDLHQFSAGLTLPAEVGGRLYLRDKSGALAAELGKSEGQPVELGLDPGAYHVVLERGGQRLQGEVVLEAGRSTLLALASLKPGGRAEVTTRRGGPGGETTDAFINVALVHPLATNALFKLPVKNRLSLAAIAAYSGEIAGVGLGGVYTVVRGPATGLLANGVGSWNGGDLTGVALGGVTTLVGGSARGVVESGVVSWVRGDLDGTAGAGVLNLVQGDARAVLVGGVASHVGGHLAGVQASGVVSTALEGFEGVQVAGVASIAPGGVSGLQVAGVYNHAANLDGAQIGLINRSRRLRGLQLGLVNVADEADGGVPIGLVSVVKKRGMHSLELAATDVMPLTLQLKLGARHFFTVLGAGLNPLREGTWWAYTAGFGYQREIGRFYVEGDLLWSGVQHSLAEYAHGTSYLTELRLIAGFRILDQLAVFVGPSLHLSVASRGDPSFSGLSSLEKEWDSGSLALRLGPGFVVGVRGL